MNTSNELLLSIINSRLKELTDKDKIKVYYDDIDLVRLIKGIEENNDNMKYLTDSLIEGIISTSKVRNKEKFISQIKSIRDVFIGKQKYKLKVDFNPKYIKDINTFLALLRDYVEVSESGLIDNENYINELKELKEKMFSNELIINFSFIEKMLNDYNSVEFESNLYKVMEYISLHNLNILKTPESILPVVETKSIKTIDEDENIKAVLDKLEIDYKNLSSDLIGGLVTVNHEVFMDNFGLISKNKAENYGILHLFSKENYKAKLVVLLYSDVETIKEVVDLTKDVNGKINVPLLKSICNNVATCFIKNENQRYKPMFENFKKNMEQLKSLEVNYPLLIKNSPLFMVASASDINFALNHLAMMGFDKKQVVNKCYKTLSINPSLIVKNSNILKSKIVDLDMFIKESKNYVLLKIDNLEDKINFLVSQKKETTTHKKLTKNIEECVVNALRNGD
ncbi:unknown [Firmicutes bacterium CAG:582]|nr:hypothetical protein [bacterium]CDB28262.1 unknown [Firmicutes bacterium CAG:582]